LHLAIGRARREEYRPWNFYYGSLSLRAVLLWQKSKLSGYARAHRVSQPKRVYHRLARFGCKFLNPVILTCPYTMSSSPLSPPPQDIRQTFARPGLRKITPYWHPYRTNAKERWLGREMLELVSTEFRDRSVEYYVRRLLLSTSLIPELTPVVSLAWHSDMRWTLA